MKFDTIFNRSPKKIEPERDISKAPVIPNNQVISPGEKLTDEQREAFTPGAEKEGDLTMTKIQKRLSSTRERQVERLAELGKTGYLYESQGIIIGDIDGHKVIIEGSVLSHKYQASIDGEILSPEESKALYYKYQDLTVDAEGYEEDIARAESELRNFPPENPIDQKSDAFSELMR